MQRALYKFAGVNDKLNEQLRLLLRYIAKLFDNFFSSQENSGDHWEYLFLIVLLIRCIARKSDESVLLPSFDNLGYERTRFQRPYRGKQFDTTSVNSFVKGIGEPDTYPHLAIYYPNNAYFKLYDVVVAYFECAKNRELYGYQLKIGRGDPSASARKYLFEKSFLISGSASSETH